MWEEMKSQYKAEEALGHLKKVVFPNLSKLADADDSFGEYMKSAECKTFGKPGLPALSEVEGLIEACKLIDQMEISQQNQDLRQCEPVRVPARGSSPCGGGCPLWG